MLLRNIQYLRAAQKLLTLPQKLSTHSAIVRSYASLEEGRGSVFKIRNNVCYKGSVCYSTQQPELKQKSEKPLDTEIERVNARLESSYQWNGFISVEQLVPVMEALKADTNLKLTHEQSLFLLNVIGCEMPTLTPVERLSNFERYWQYLQENGQITKDHYSIMLQILQYNCSPIQDYRIILKECEKFNLSPKEILPQLLAVAGASGNVKQTTEILSDMRSLQLSLTERDFNSLILAHARAKDMDGVKTVLDSMHATGFPISTETQSTLIVAHVENGDQTKATALLQQFHGQYKFSDIIKILKTVVHVEEISQDFIVQLVKEFNEDYVKGPEVPISLRRLCVELLHNNKLDYALTILNNLPNPQFQENQDIDTYGVFLLHALFKANCELEKIIDIAIQLEDSHKNTKALHKAAEIALKRNPPMVLKIFDELTKREQPLRPHYFWPLIMYNFRRHNEAGIIRSLKIMQDFKVECDHQTIVEYVIPRLSTLLINPPMILKQLEATGIKTSSMLTPIVSHLLVQNKWLEVVPLIEPYTTKIKFTDLITPLCSVAVHVRATKRYHHLAKLLNALVKKNTDGTQDVMGQFLIELLSTQSRMRNDLYSYKRLLLEMEKFGLNISPAAAATIRNLLAETNEQHSPDDLAIIKRKLNEMTKRDLILTNISEDGTMMASSFIKHPRDMSLDELECHLVELESKQMNARGILRRLLQVCVRDNRLERALEIKNKCDKLKVQISPGMLASIFDLYTKLEDLTQAENSLQTLKKNYPGFNIDEHKFVDYAALLVKNGQLENAKKLLEERSLNHRIIGGDYILKNIWKLLTNVAHLSTITKDLTTERNLTRETFAFLQKLGYCKTHNAILGPIVRERLLRGDLVAAVNELKQLSQQYKQTPLQFELFSLVVRLCNGNEELLKKYNCNVEQAQQLLADITEIVTQIHGEVNMNSGLLLAFAESGSDNQLRRLLITPEFRINEELLLRNCDHLGQEGAVNTLLRLARGARGLNRIINEQNIYNMLLNNFIKVNNYEAALDLYNRLELDDDLKISQEFLRSLVQLLKTNNIEIPSNIALRAHIL